MNKYKNTKDILMGILLFWCVKGLWMFFDEGVNERLPNMGEFFWMNDLNEDGLAIRVN